MTGRVRAALLLSSLGIVALHAQADPYRYERPVETTGAGPRRLAIDFALLAGGAPFLTNGGVASGGLSDLRFVDAAGAPVPHLLLYASRGDGARPAPARPAGSSGAPGWRGSCVTAWLKAPFGSRSVRRMNRRSI